MGIRRTFAIAAIVALSGAAVASGASPKLNGSFSGQFPDGFGQLTLKFKNGKVTEVSAPLVKANVKNCDDQAPASDFQDGFSATGTTLLPNVHEKVTQFFQNGAYQGRALWAQNQASNNAYIDFAWKPPRSQNKISLFGVHANWSYTDSQGYSGFCNTAYLKGTVTKGH